MDMLTWLRKLLEEADVDLLREMVLSKVMPLPRSAMTDGRVLAVTRNSGMVATRAPGSWPRKSRLAASRPPDESLDQRHHPLAAEGFSETLGTTFGDHNMAVVKQPIHGRTGECLGHERVEPGRVDV